MGRSQLQYNRRARGRGRGGGGRGAAGAPAGGGGGRVASAKASQQAALRTLPSNQDRFQRGGGGGSGGGGEGRLRSDEEGGDDLREYALSTDSRMGHRHVLAEEGADGEASGDLPSVSLDLGALAEGLCCLPAHIRLGGVDPALTEGLMYREGYPPSNEGEASTPSAPKSLVELVGSMTSASKDKHTSSATTPPSAPPPPSFEPPLEALLGLDLSSSSTVKEKRKEVAKPAAASSSTSFFSALPSDLDDLLNMGLSARKSAETAGGNSGKSTIMPSDRGDDDVLNDLLGQPKMLTSSVPSSKSNAKKLSALDAGDY